MLSSGGAPLQFEPLPITPPSLVVYIGVASDLAGMEHNSAGEQCDRSNPADRDKLHIPCMQVVKSVRHFQFYQKHVMAILRGAPYDRAELLLCTPQLPLP